MDELLLEILSRQAEARDKLISTQLEYIDALITKNKALQEQNESLNNLNARLNAECERLSAENTRLMEVLR